MTDEGFKAIDEIAVGDLVLTAREGSEETAYLPVVRTFTRPASAVRTLRLVDEDGGAETLTVTPEHPFWVRDRGWTPARELTASDRVRSVHGGWLRVGAGTSAPLRAATTTTTVFNIEVAGYHTYFVGGLGAWVHNASNKNCTTRIRDAVIGDEAVVTIDVRPFGGYLGNGHLKNFKSQAQYERLLLKHANEQLEEFAYLVRTQRRQMLNRLRRFAPGKRSGRTTKELDRLREEYRTGFRRPTDGPPVHAAHALDAVAGGRPHIFIGFRNGNINSQLGLVWTLLRQAEPKFLERVVKSGKPLRFEFNFLKRVP